MRTHLTRVEREIHDAVTTSRLADFSTPSTPDDEGVARWRGSATWDSASWAAASPAGCSTAGHEVTGYNRTRSKAEPLIADGMRFADTPREAAEQSDVIVLDGDEHAGAHRHHRRAGRHPRRARSPGKVYVDMSTVSPAASRGLAERVARARRRRCSTRRSRAA